MGFFDKIAGGVKPPPYQQQQTASNNPYPPVTPAQGAQQNTYPAYNQPATQSQSTPASTPADNDNRALPPGWEKQWHEGYSRFFYVDTQAPGGPQSHWIHPADQAGGGQRTTYSQPIPQPQTPYPQQPYQPQNYQQPMYSQPQAYQQPNHSQPPPVTNQRPGRTGGMNPMLAGAGGLAGGMLLGSMLHGGGHHHHHHDSYQDGYMNGYENGYDNGFDNGDSYGDFGGGDFDF